VNVSSGTGLPAYPGCPGQTAVKWLLLLLLLLLSGVALSCYLNKIESVSLIKCPYDHRRTNKAYLSAITATNISKSFYPQDGGKNQLAYRYGRNCVTVTSLVLEVDDR